MPRLSREQLISTAAPFVRRSGASGSYLAPARQPVDHLDWGVMEDSARPSDVRFIQHCGHWSHYDDDAGGSVWPIPHVSTVEELAAFGSAYNVLYSEPEPGDVFLQYARQRKAFVHAGIVVAVLGAGEYDIKTRYYDVYAMEADTQERHCLDEATLVRVRRRLSPAVGDRFLRWVELDELVGLYGAPLRHDVASRWIA